jgi:hypothetical protein
MLACAALAVLLVVGCVRQRAGPHAPPAIAPALRQAVASSRTVGHGARYQPPPHSNAVDGARSIDGMACALHTRAFAASHVELFAYQHVVIVPAGIGLSPPLKTRGARVKAARCAYPLRTLDPTGLVLLADPARTYRLGEFFDLWGQTLDRRRMAGFQAPIHDRVRVYLDGMSWRGDPRNAPIAPRAQMTIEVGGYVPPHAHYDFPSLVWAGS